MRRSRLLIVAAALFPSSACWLAAPEVYEKVEQRPDTATDTSDASDTDDTSDTSDTVDTGPSTCADVHLGTRTGEPVSEGSLSGAPNSDQGSCGGLGPDRTFYWTAPRSGCFAFATEGSTADTLIYLRAASSAQDCDGVELACHTDLVPGQAGFESAYIGHPMSAGQGVVVVVDTPIPQTSGDYALTVNEVPPLPTHADLGNAQGSLIYFGTTTGRSDTLPNANPCPVDSGRDALLKWTPPSTANWRIEVSAFFDAVLSVHDACNAQGIACVDQFGTSGESLSVQANAGEPLWIRVAGYDEGAGAASGDFAISITRL